MECKENISDESKIKALAFARIQKIPPEIKKKLLADLGSPGNVFDAVYGSEMIGSFYGEEVAKLLRDFPLKKDIEREVHEAASRGIEIIEYTSAKYPELLRQIADPPFIIYKMGKDIPTDRLCIAIVGSRGANTYGLDHSRRISMELASTGVCIISGMAHGIDSAAHAGCIDNGGHTVAVLGSGICDPYPRSNRRLFELVASSGTVISEFPLHQQPFKGNFPRRNRIVSGLSHGVFVVQAAFKSGARITSRLALEQNRDVFALPGPADSKLSEGANELIKRGLAKLVTNSKDILEEYESQKELFSFEKPARMCINAPFSDNEKKVLSNLDENSKISIDELGELTGLNYNRLLDSILNLELKGIIKRRPGNMLQREMGLNGKVISNS